MDRLVDQTVEAVEPAATDNSTRRRVPQEGAVNSVWRREQFSSNENWSSPDDKASACSLWRGRTCSFNVMGEGGCRGVCL